MAKYIVRDIVTQEAFKVCKQTLLQEMDFEAETITGSFSLPEEWLDDQKSKFKTIIKESDDDVQLVKNIMECYTSLPEVLAAFLIVHARIVKVNTMVSMAKDVGMPIDLMQLILNK